MYAFKRVIVVSALTVTANSWGYPIYPYAEFFNRLDSHRSLNIKSDVSALIRSYIEQSSAEEVAKTAVEKQSTAAGASNSSSSVSNEVVDFDRRLNRSWDSESSWDFANQNRSAQTASPRFWYGEQQGEKTSDQALKEIGSLKEVASLAQGNENSMLWAGLNLKDVLPNGNGEEVANNKIDAPKKDDISAADGEVGRVSVSEPGSIVLVGSGILGLLLARRSSRCGQKNL